jgi:hypothetical protein
MDTFNLKKLIEMEVKEEFQPKISNRFAALEKFFNGGNISRVWEHITENSKMSRKESNGQNEWK